MAAGPPGGETLGAYRLLPNQLLSKGQGHVAAAKQVMEWELLGKDSGLNRVPLNSHVETLTPSTSECGCIWRQDLSKGN